MGIYGKKEVIIQLKYNIKNTRAFFKFNLDLEMYNVYECKYN